MNKILSFCLWCFSLCFLALFCSCAADLPTNALNDKQDSPGNKVAPERLQKLQTESFYWTDSTSLGKGGYLFRMRQGSNKDGIVLYIRLSKKDKGSWQLMQQFPVKMDEVIPPDPQFNDFNNDGFRDFSFRRFQPARGINETRQLYLFDPEKGLVEISNSTEYANLRFNEKLNCIDAWNVHGGSDSYFLRLDGNELKPFACVELSDADSGMTYRSVYEITANGNRRELSSEKVKGLDSYTRYTGYDPLREWKEEK